MNAKQVYNINPDFTFKLILEIVQLYILFNLRLLLKDPKFTFIQLETSPHNVL